MPMFSQESMSKLSTCHPELQSLFYEVIKYFDLTVLEGHRNQVDQDKAYADGNSKLKWPHGKHNTNPSNAVDVAPYPVNFNDTQRYHYFAGVVMGIAKMLLANGKMTYGIKWGGDWDNDTQVKDENFRDLGHFELML